MKGGKVSRKRKSLSTISSPSQPSPKRVALNSPPPSTAVTATTATAIATVEGGPACISPVTSPSPAFSPSSKRVTHNSPPPSAASAAGEDGTASTVPMGVKKQKRHRRAVRFYTACFGFREPFKILCDGTFVHHLLVNRITPADTALANILGATVKLFTTRCVLAELNSLVLAKLKSLGGSYQESLNAANNLPTARCDHETQKSAVDCITEVIGENNSEHFFVATQDADLRRSLQKIPGVPVIFALRNALFLEQPSSFQRQFAKSAEEERLHMTDLELNMLRQREKRKLSDDKRGDSSDASVSQIQTINTNVKTNGSDVKDKVRFKRKKAKGPNPLSVKKKKKPVDTNFTTAGKVVVGDEVDEKSGGRKLSQKTYNLCLKAQESKNDEGTVRSRKKRKRSRKRVVQGNA